MQFIGSTPLLSSESTAEFRSLHDQLERELEPQDLIERIWTQDFAVLTFEIFRCRRFKIDIIRIAMVRALADIIMQIKPCRDFLDTIDAEIKARQQANAFFHDPKAKQEILQMLSDAGLDESSVEAAGFRLERVALSALEGTLSDLERRRYKLLRNIDRKRKSFAAKVRLTTARIDEADARTAAHAQ